MPGKYTDQESITFSRIAYQDLNDGYQMALRSGKYPDGKVPLSALPPSDIAKLKNECGLTDSQINSWKLADVHDTNAKNGFYGCVVDTGDGRAAVAFRGSEDMLVDNNGPDDWADADFKLLNQTQTRQHAEVDRFLAKNKDMLSQYDSISTTGHSLGGNLAEYATIVSDKYGLDGKFKQCTSLDGPGFNKEFLAEHADEIARMKDKMTHYKWSLVGNCLDDPAGKDIPARVTDDGVNKPLTRHDMKYVDVDEHGNIKRNDRPLDLFDGGIINNFTTWLDKFPKPVKDGIVFVTNAVFNSVVQVIKPVKETIDKVTGFFKGFFDGDKGKSGGGSGGGHGFGKGGSGPKDRLLVSTEAMTATINRYKQARERMDAAAKRMDAAWDRLNSVWDGAAKIAFMGEWVVLMGNVRKSEQAIEKSIRGLTRTVELFTSNESDLTGRAQNLDPGTIPPLF